MEIAIILGVVGLAVFLNAVATWMVRRSVALTRFQKSAQMVLIWVVPFVGAILVISILTDPEDRARRQKRWVPNDGGSFGGDGDVASREADPHRGHWGDSRHDAHGGDGGHGGDRGWALIVGDSRDLYELARESRALRSRVRKASRRGPVEGAKWQ